MSLDSALEFARLRRRLPPPATRRQLRERAGIAQQVVAEALGVDRAAVSRWETGDRDPRGEQLRGYLQLLNRLAREAARR